VLRFLNFGHIIMLMCLLGIGILLLFLNSLWNLLKKRAGHFFFGVLLVIFIFVFACFFGLMLRDQRRIQFDTIRAPNMKCRDFVNNFSQSDIEGACPNKYLA
jgi:hypothetical protein